MDPKLKAILMKAKAIDQAAKKYDTVPSDVLESRVSSRTSSGGGLMDQVIGESAGSSYNPIDVNSEMYKERVTSSKLPPEIQRAMMENPIPQASMVDQISEDDIRDLNPMSYSEEDEYEVNSRSRQISPKKRIVETPQPKSVSSESSISSSQIRKMIAEEIAKALPGIIENYFDKKVIQENMRVMKHVIKNSQR